MATITIEVTEDLCLKSALIPITTNKELAEPTSYHGKPSGHVISSSTKTQRAFYSPAMSSVRFWLRTMWLFTETDVKTNIIPSFLFAAMTTVALLTSTAASSASPTSYPTLLIALRTFSVLPQILLWIYSCNLLLDISNQLPASAIEEDLINKPWRPIASGRITKHAAKQMLIACFTLVLATAPITDTTAETCVVLLCGWLYNSPSVRGSDVWWSRMLLCGIGFPTFLCGALQASLSTLANYSSDPLVWELMSKSGSPTTTLLAWHLNKWWLVLISLTVMSTQHAIDIFDQVGDRARGRTTVPIKIGDVASRYLLAVASVLMSAAHCGYWACLDLKGALTMALGLTVAIRTTVWRDGHSDKRTELVWALWMVSLYVLPLIKALS